MKERDSDHFVDVLVILGIAASLVLIVGSVLLNFRMAYRSADTEFDAWLYGVVAGAADCIKAMMPFAIAWGIRKRDRLAVIGAAAVFGIFTLYSFSSAVGFAAQHRIAKAAERQGGAEKYQDLKDRYTRAKSARDALGTPRAPSVIEQERADILATPVYGRRTIGDLSGECTLNRLEAREPCERWRRLGVELATAKEAGRLDGELTDVRQKLDTVPAASTTEDPQAAAISKLGGWFDRTFRSDDVQLGLALLLALLVEAGSGLGLYLVTTPWRDAALPAPKESTMPPKLPVMPVKRLGEVDAFMLARLHPATDGVLTAPMLYEAYLGWCREGGLAPFTVPAFITAFHAIADELGIERGSVGTDAAWRNVSFTPVPALPERAL
ncbi:hypothetical protein KKP04_11265 [Rhodomicrobium sp. Az07]|uniref:hypothetical protein n=1 Tax=Rhodomicrobium sp. Az07 TaxID=2839034 RepID=UPI001BEBB880|nr:hypothetical protein [Rhodomicrobium sp. Az07]MBT3071443.1 hypothetical protein [Rhodomicrobium sp. Az07]